MQAMKAAAEEERRAQELEKMRIEAEFKRAKAERELMEQRRRHEEELAKEQDEEKRKGIKTAARTRNGSFKNSTNVATQGSP